MKIYYIVVIAAGFFAMTFLLSFSGTIMLNSNFPKSAIIVHLIASIIAALGYVTATVKAIPK